MVENLTMVCYYIAIFSTVLFIIKTIIFAFTGGDTEVVADFSSDFELETSFDFLSIQSVLAFLMGFGWIGLAGITQWHLRLVYAMLIAIGFGLVLMFGTAYLMFLVKKLNKRVIIDYSACIGTTARTYTSFSALGEGQIEVEVNGKLSIEKATNQSQEEISAFSSVRIIDYKDNTFYIENI